MKEIYDNAGKVQFGDTNFRTSKSDALTQLSTVFIVAESDTRSKKLNNDTVQPGTAPRSSGRRCGRAALCGVITVFLFVGLVGFVVYFHRSIHDDTLAEFSSKHKETCPTGWTMFNSSCYLTSTAAHSWTEGREDCIQRGADLVVVDSAREQDFLSRLTTEAAWIGLSDHNDEGTWKWVDGTPLTKTFWAKGQPDNHGGKAWRGNEDCAHIRAHSAEWNDLHCKDSLRWVCEKKIK